MGHHGDSGDSESSLFSLQDPEIVWSETKIQG